MTVGRLYMKRVAKATRKLFGSFLKVVLIFRFEIAGFLLLQRSLSTEEKPRLRLLEIGDMSLSSVFSFITRNPDGFDITRAFADSWVLADGTGD